MKYQYAQRGFTLIELLVVILIIGILAAVAVPQYQKAVEKSQATEAQSMLAAIYKAYEIYYLANGTDPTSFSLLDIDVPGERTTTSSDEKFLRDIYLNRDWAFILTANPASGAAGVVAIRISGNYQGAGFAIWRYHYRPRLSKRLTCLEIRSPNYYPSGISKFKKTKGNYCVKIFNGEEVQTEDSSYSFRMP